MPLPHGLSPDEFEIARAVTHIRRDYQRIHDKLTQALGREPTSTEMLEVAPRHIDLLQQIHDMMDARRRKHANCVPDSMLTQIHLSKVLDESPLV